MPLPTPDIEGAKKFKEYRDKGLTYRDIQKLMGKSLKTLSRWNTYLHDGLLVGKLSTGRTLTVDK